MSFRLPDPYEGFSAPRLKRRCRELVRIAMHKDDLIRMLLKRVPTGLAAVPEKHREEVRRIFTELDD